MKFAKLVRTPALTLFIAAVVALVAVSVSNAGNYKSSSYHSASYQKDIVDTAVSAGSFNTLVTAVQTAGLVDTLKGDGPFTVFAPTDAAFAKLPEGTLEALLKDKDKLTAILTYHVVPGKVMAADVVSMKMAKTVNGESLSIRADNGDVMIDNAKVIKTDIQARNGVIHVIDTVVIP
jgi:uncharacterized surface protein with fasciclin (FAS1) repeats